MNIYSDIDLQLNLLLVVEDETQAQLAELIMSKSYDEWFDINSEIQQVGFVDYLEEQLQQCRIRYELYIKSGGTV